MVACSRSTFVGQPQRRNYIGREPARGAGDLIVTQRGSKSSATLLMHQR
jgi:hypothetical protein